MTQSNLVDLSAARLQKEKKMAAESLLKSQSQQSQLIYGKMIQIMAEIGPVSKDQTNTVQKFKFRGIDQFVNALHPALAKHKVFMVPKCISSSHEMKEVIRNTGKEGIDKHVHMLVEYTFFAEDGSSVVIGPIPAEGLDGGDKATTKALSAALKYCLIQTFCIPTEDMSESDLDSPEIQHPRAVYPVNAPSNSRRDSLNRELMSLYKPFMTQFPNQSIPGILDERYRVDEVSHMTVEMMADLVTFLKTEMAQSSQEPSHAKSGGVIIKKPNEQAVTKQQIKEMFDFAKTKDVHVESIKHYIRNEFDKHSTDALSFPELRILNDAITDGKINKVPSRPPVAPVVSSSVASNAVSDEDLPWNRDASQNLFVID